jgi:chromosome segregation ATPase
MSSMNGTPMNGTANGRATNGSASHLAWSDPEHTELEHEMDRLRSELADARARLDAAKERLARRDADLHEALREELNRSQQMMAEREQRHRQTIADIREAARQEAERIVHAARVGDTPSASEVAPDWVQHGQ